MKLKYYLNGFGAGVLFATIVLSIAFYINSGKGQIKDQNVDMTTTAEQQEITTEITTAEIVKESTEETSTEESITETTPEETTTEEKIEETSTEQITEETQEITKESTEGQAVSFKILSGMSSDMVAKKLEELGIIQSAQDFDNYLIRKGYDNKIHPGNYEISVGADYETILDQICR